MSEPALKISDRMRELVGKDAIRIRRCLRNFPVEVEVYEPYERVVFEGVRQFDATMNTPVMRDCWWAT